MLGPIVYNIIAHLALLYYFSLDIIGFKVKNKNNVGGRQRTERGKEWEKD